MFSLHNICSLFICGVLLCCSDFLYCFLQRIHIARNAEHCNSQSDSVVSIRHSITFQYCVQTNEEFEDTDFLPRNVIKYTN